VPVVERSERHIMERVSGPAMHTHEVIYEQGQGLGGYQQQGFQQQQFLQQQAQPNQYLQQAQPTINQQPIGMMHQTQVYSFIISLSVPPPLSPLLT
jgi:hypothetical protein